MILCYRMIAMKYEARAIEQKWQKKFNYAMMMLKSMAVYCHISRRL